MNRRKFLKYFAGAALATGTAAGAYYLSSSAGTSLSITSETATTSLNPIRSSTTTLSSTFTSSEKEPRQGYPLLGNYDHWHTTIDLSEIDQFARWNMLALNFETAYYAKSPLRKIKELNPDIKILAWISLGLFNPMPIMNGPLGGKFLNDSTEDWWIHTRGTGPPSMRRLQMVAYYPSLVTPNPKSEFADSIVRFLQEEVLSTDLYDGIFYDCVWDDGWISQQLANADVTPTEYRDGITSILQRTREEVGSEGLIMGNPGVQWGDNCQYWDYANGHYQENALGDVFGSDWNEMWEIYQRNMRRVSPPPRSHWIGVDTQYRRKRDAYQNVLRLDLTNDDLRRMRLGLGTALLLDNGYFGFDKGDGWHGCGQQWWFPEYYANLGFPSSNYEKAGDGTYRRRYDNGLVIVNPGFDRTIDLSVKYRDVATNEISDRIKVPARDARLLITA